MRNSGYSQPTATPHSSCCQVVSCSETLTLAVQAAMISLAKPNLMVANAYNHECIGHVRAERIMSPICCLHDSTTPPGSWRWIIIYGVRSNSTTNSVLVFVLHSFPFQVRMAPEIVHGLIETISSSAFILRAPSLFEGRFIFQDKAQGQD